MNTRKLINVAKGSEVRYRYRQDAISCPDSYDFPEVRGVATGRLQAILPAPGHVGTAVIRELRSRWNYEMKPKGWSDTRWQIHGKDRKPVFYSIYRRVSVRDVLSIEGPPLIDEGKVERGFDG